jgi:hypothetical protein
MDTIFKDIPLVETNEELQHLKEKLLIDEYFLTSGACQDRREYFSKLYERTKIYLDSEHQKSDETMRIPGKFHPVAWEMLCCDLLLSQNYVIISKDHGPDIRVTTPEEVYIECISVEKGKANIPDILPGTVGTEPTDQILSRITHGIYEKHEIYKSRFIQQDDISPNIPYVIAVNSGNLGYSQSYLGAPLALKGLIGFECIQYDEFGNRLLKYRKEAKFKKGSRPACVDIFCNDENASLISGIIWSSESVLNLQHNREENIWFIPNPYAKNPLSRDFLRGTSRVNLKQNPDKSLTWSLQVAS